jgi:hypothetical protein
VLYVQRFDSPDPLKNGVSLFERRDLGMPKNVQIYIGISIERVHGIGAEAEYAP